MINFVKSGTAKIHEKSSFFEDCKVEAIQLPKPKFGCVYVIKNYLQTKFRGILKGHPFFCV